MIKTIAALALGLLLSAGGAMAQAVDTWSGHYRYEWDGGRTAGGSSMMLTYDLRVGSQQSCRLDITGFQTDEHILCEIGANADNLWIRFRSYADGKLVNRYNVARFKPGQDLFRLRRNGGNPPLTEWQSMSPEAGRTSPAIRFKRV